MGPKDANVMEKSLNPDQTSFWVHIVCQDLTVRKLMQNCCNYFRIWTMWFYHGVIHPNNADRLANSVDPDQRFGSTLFSQKCLSQSIEKLQLYFKTIWVYRWVMCPKDADRMANSADPAPSGVVWSGSTLFAQTCLSENLKLLVSLQHCQPTRNSTSSRVTIGRWVKLT